MSQDPCEKSIRFKKKSLFYISAVVILIVLIILPFSLSMIKKDYRTIEFSLGDKTILMGNHQKKLKSAPWKTENGTIMVPLKVITEAFGCTVRWIPEDRIVMLIFEKKKTAITMEMDSTIAIIEGNDGLKTQVMMSYPMIIKEHTIFIPLEFVSNAFDLEITNLDS